ncbi:unnamed protein product, partial [Iphiclides podalirius]
MIILNILILNAFVATWNVLANEFDSEDMYMLVSPDQHTRTPRLEDFFWTGSGDGPPPPDLAAPAPSPSKPIVHTTTVLATVYLDSYPPQAVTDKTTGDCLMNCGEVGIPDSLEPEIPEDRRYWLLTVIQGSTPDSLQLRLARLYQKAFLRQQERHLGIVKSLDAPTPRKKHDVHSFVVNKDTNLNQVESTSQMPVEHNDIHNSLLNVSNVIYSSVTTHLVSSPPSNLPVNFSQVYPENLDASANEQNFSKGYAAIVPTKLSDNDLWVLVTPTVILKKRDASSMEVEKEAADLIDIPLEEDASDESSLSKREILRPEQQPPVRVHIQNITESSETGSVEIVYVVLVGGRAVPAAVAARDMRLVRDAEVARELGAPVTTKAEPYLKAAAGLEGGATATSPSTELWALGIASAAAVLIILVLLLLLCLAHRRKTKKSAASLRAYRNELMREVERSQMKQVHEERDGRVDFINMFMPINSSSTTSGISEVAAALRTRQKKRHALKMPHKKRVGASDSLLVSAGLDSSDSAPHTPTSHLSMPSLAAFPRGNAVEPLSRILEPVSVRHLDVETPPPTPKAHAHAQRGEGAPRRQMASQLVRLGSIDKDPGVIGPLVWDLHCQRIKSAPRQQSPRWKGQKEGASRMRQRFNELMDDAFTLFGSASSGSQGRALGGGGAGEGESATERVTEARNDSVRAPTVSAAPPTLATLPTARPMPTPRTSPTPRGLSAGASSSVRPQRRGEAVGTSDGRPRTTQTHVGERRAPPQRAWPASPARTAPPVHPEFILAQGRLPPDDPALPLISAIKDEIKRVRDNATKSHT